MARKVKFPLELRDGYLARSNIEEVRAHFDLEKIIAQFHNGRLKIWLEDHYLSEMAEQVAALDGDAPDLAAQLCTILGVEALQRRMWTAALSKNARRSVSGSASTPRIQFSVTWQSSLRSSRGIWTGSSRRAHRRLSCAMRISASH